MYGATANGNTRFYYNINSASWFQSDTAGSDDSCRFFMPSLTKAYEIRLLKKLEISFNVSVGRGVEA